MITKFYYKKAEFTLHNVTIQKSFSLEDLLKDRFLEEKNVFYKSNQYISFIEISISDRLDHVYYTYTTNNYYLIVNTRLSATLGKVKPYSFFRIYKDTKITIDKLINNKLIFSFGNSANEALENVINKIKGRELFR